MCNKFIKCLYLFLVQLFVITTRCFIVWFNISSFFVSIKQCSHDTQKTHIINFYGFVFGLFRLRLSIVPYIHTINNFLFLVEIFSQTKSSLVSFNYGNINLNKRNNYFTFCLKKRLVFVFTMTYQSVLHLVGQVVEK